MATKTHWKKLFDYKYLGAYSLSDSQDELDDDENRKAIYTARVVTIQNITMEIVANERGSENLPICYFKEKIGDKKKGMVLNRTNCKICEELFLSTYYEDWIGKKIELYVDEKIRAKGGGNVEGLRFRAITPEVKKPELTPKHKLWKKAIERVNEGKTIDDIREHFEITQENFDLLCKPQ